MSDAHLTRQLRELEPPAQAGKEKAMHSQATEAIPSIFRQLKLRTIGYNQYWRKLWHMPSHRVSQAQPDAPVRLSSDLIDADIYPDRIEWRPDAAAIVEYRIKLAASDIAHRHNNAFDGARARRLRRERDQIAAQVRAEYKLPPIVEPITRPIRAHRCTAAEGRRNALDWGFNAVGMTVIDEAEVTNAAEVAARKAERQLIVDRINAEITRRTTHLVNPLWSADSVEADLRNRLGNLVWSLKTGVRVQPLERKP